jgi:hypothetical protein
MESRKLPAPVVIPAEVEELSSQIELWRSTRQQRCRMPEPLWDKAANLAKQDGLARIANFLHLDYYSLKERVQVPSRDDTAALESSPTFIELPNLAMSAAVSECSIELEHPRGARMRIHVKGTVLPDLTVLTGTFWGMKG